MKEDIKTVFTDRKEIGIRLLFAILFLIIFEIVKLIVQLAVLVQYIYLLITKKHLEPVRKFSNRVSSYGYRVMRFLTLNENRVPFPFSNFPEEVQPAEDVVFGTYSSENEAQTEEKEVQTENQD